MSHSSKRPQYLDTSIIQCLKMNPETKIYLIEENNKNKEARTSYLGYLNIIKYNELGENKCLICKLLLKQIFYFHGKNLYYTNTIKRYISLFLFMKKYNIQNIFHVESDVMIYGNFKKLLKKLQICDADISFPGNVGSIVFFKNYTSALEMLKSFVATLKIWQKNPIPKKHINDMHLLVYFREKYRTDRQIKFIELPSNPFKHEYNCLLKIDNLTIYDPNFFGQAIDGTPSSVGVPYFFNSPPFLNISTVDKIMLKNYKNDKIFYFESYRLFNLHIHSKRLSKFLSDK